ncbi:unnamed protein product [Nippostrongylus brasiliensis]|uniref:Glutaredoxin domain-containing protein n=1 Tax=Nippostrongylus brasiliensis TaxID=27835 RepID=A0A0N4XPW5_NIPBR|nr:unnamed protein product [Nippostrongylus brasiliensis]
MGGLQNGNYDLFQCASFFTFHGLRVPRPRLYLKSCVKVSLIVGFRAHSGDAASGFTAATARKRRYVVPKVTLFAESSCQECKFAVDLLHNAWGDKTTEECVALGALVPTEVMKSQEVQLDGKYVVENVEVYVM